MKNKKIFSLIAFVALFIIFGLYFYKNVFKKEPRVTSFEECVAAGYPVAESYPRQCRTYDNAIFTETIGNEVEKNNLIMVDNPRPNTVIASPLQITGQARGSWFFEANFSVRLLDGDSNIIGTGTAVAQGDWMTEEFVPFKASITFAPPATETGSLILDKSNPSGLPEHDDHVTIPVKFR